MKSKIDTHPKKQEIIRDISRGLTYKTIGEKYGISDAAICRYVKKEIIPAAALSMAEKKIDGETVLSELDLLIRQMRKTLNACDEALADPANPEKYYIGPKAKDIEVTFIDRTEPQRPFTRKERLQELLDKNLPKHSIVQELKSHQVDPSIILVKTAEALTKQLNLLARIQGQIKDVTINIAESRVWYDLKMVIIETTKDFPEVQKKIVDGIRSLRSDN